MKHIAHPGPDDEEMIDESRVFADKDLAHAATRALTIAPGVPDSRIKAVVINGWITLEGRAAKASQRSAAEDAIRHLPGTSGITNHIVIEQRLKAEDVEGRVAEAFHRRAEMDAEQISAVVEKGSVTLRGVVRTSELRDRAETAVWGLPGVDRVHNELTVKVQGEE
jgi:osmotically-inducible protein OsmY